MGVSEVLVACAVRQSKACKLLASAAFGANPNSRESRDSGDCEDLDNDNGQSEPETFYVCGGCKPYGDLHRSLAECGKAFSFGFHCAVLREGRDRSRAMAVHALGLKRPSDIVSAL